MDLQAQPVGIERRRQSLRRTGLFQEGEIFQVGILSGKTQVMKKKRNMTIINAGTILALILLFLLTRMGQERRNNIELYGIETVGTVIHKSRGGNPFFEGQQFSVRFEFEDSNGEKFVVTETSSNRKNHDNAIIGMTYVVKYLPDNPRRAIILIDRPVKRELNHLDFLNSTQVETSQNE